MSAIGENIVKQQAHDSLHAAIQVCGLQRPAQQTFTVTKLCLI